MSHKVACSCGKNFVVRDEQLGKSLRCPGCGARLDTSRGPSSEVAPPKPVAPPAALSGAEALAALLNNMSPQGAKNFAAALNAAGSPPKPGKGKPHRYGTLGCALPLALLFCTSFTALFVMPGGDPPPLGAYFFVGALALGFIALTVWRMWGRWRRGSVVWCACLAGFFALAITIAAVSARADQALSAKFAPVVQALGDVGGLQRRSDAGLRPKVLPVALTKKGAKKGDAKTPPEVAVELYRSLPDSLRAAGPDEVQTVVLLDYGWNYWGTYHNQVAGNAGNAYVGTCVVTVMDRKSRLVVASTTLESPERPPTEKLTAMEWYGPQPGDEEIVKYLQGLPTRSGDLAPLPQDDGQDKADPAEPRPQDK